MLTAPVSFAVICLFYFSYFPKVRQNVKMSAPAATGIQHGWTKKRIIVGAPVSGCFGDYIPISDAVHVTNPNKHL